MKEKPPYFDLRFLTENQQIRVLGEQASAGKKVGFIIPDAHRKRFLGKLKRRFPDCEYTEIGPIDEKNVAFSLKRIAN